MYDLVPGMSRTQRPSMLYIRKGPKVPLQFVKYSISYFHI